MYNGKKKPFTSHSSRFTNNNDSPDFNEVYDMVEEGLPIRDIARDLNISEQFLNNMVNQMYKED